MNQTEFASNLKAAETFRTLAERPDETDFWTGYIRGLRRSFHGIVFGTELEHQLWLTLEGDPSREARRNGYLAGCTSLTVQEILLSRQREDWIEEHPDKWEGIQDGLNDPSAG